MVLIIHFDSNSIYMDISLCEKRFLNMIFYMLFSLLALIHL